MVQEHSLATMFSSLAQQEFPPIIELLDINKKPVGALYLSSLKYKQFTVSETNSSEKYFLVVDGVGIYFSFYKKLSL